MAPASSTRYQITASMMQRDPVALLKEVETRCQALAKATAVAVQWRADAARISAANAPPRYQEGFDGNQARSAYASTAMRANLALTHEPAELLAVRKAHAAYRAGIETLRTWMATAQTAFLDELERMERPDAPPIPPSPILAYAPSPSEGPPAATHAPTISEASAPIPDVLSLDPQFPAVSPANTSQGQSPLPLKADETSSGAGNEAMDVDQPATSQTSPQPTQAAPGAQPGVQPPQPGQPAQQVPSGQRLVPTSPKASDATPPQAQTSQAASKESAPALVPPAPAQAPTSTSSGPNAGDSVLALAQPPSNSSGPAPVPPQGQHFSSRGVVDLTLEDDEAASSPAHKVINLASSTHNSPSPLLSQANPPAPAPVSAPVSASASAGASNATTPPSITGPVSTQGPTDTSAAAGSTPTPTPIPAAPAPPATGTPTTSAGLANPTPAPNTNMPAPVPQDLATTGFSMSPLPEFSMDDLEGFDFGPPPAGLDLSELEFETAPNSARGSFDFTAMMNDFGGDGGN